MSAIQIFWGGEGAEPKNRCMVSEWSVRYAPSPFKPPQIINLGAAYGDPNTIYVYTNNTSKCNNISRPLLVISETHQHWRSPVSMFRQPSRYCKMASSVTSLPPAPLHLGLWLAEPWPYNDSRIASQRRWSNRPAKHHNWASWRFNRIYNRTNSIRAGTQKLLSVYFYCRSKY